MPMPAHEKVRGCRYGFCNAQVARNEQLVSGIKVSVSDAGWTSRGTQQPVRCRLPARRHDHLRPEFPFPDRLDTESNGQSIGCDRFTDKDRPCKPQPHRAVKLTRSGSAGSTSQQHADDPYFGRHVGRVANGRQAHRARRVELKADPQGFDLATPCPRPTRSNRLSTSSGAPRRWTRRRCQPRYAGRDRSH